jgi:hypothetical protein
MTVIFPERLSENAAIRRVAARNAAAPGAAVPGAAALGAARSRANQAEIDECMQWALTALVMAGTLLMFQGLLRGVAAPSAQGRLIETALLGAAGLLGLGAMLALAIGLAKLVRPPDGQKAGFRKR